MHGAPVYRAVISTEFLEFRFGDRRAELDRGVVRVLDGVAARHSEVQGNLIAAFRERLRGSGMAVFSSLMPIVTGPCSVRVADLVVAERAPALDSEGLDALTAPRVIFEIHSDDATRTDFRVKLPEYRALPSVDTIVLVDIASERLRIVQRTGSGSWNDQAHDRPVDVALPALGITLSHAEIFARD